MKLRKKPANTLTTKELAERWDIHPYTLANWRHKSRGPKYYKRGKYKTAEIYYKLSDIKKYEKSQVDIEINTEDTAS